MSENLLTAREVAERLGVSQRWVLTKYRAGLIPGTALLGQTRPIVFSWPQVARAVGIVEDAPPNLRRIGT